MAISGFNDSQTKHLATFLHTTGTVSLVPILWYLLLDNSVPIPITTDQMVWLISLFLVAEGVALAILKNVKRQ